MAQHIIKNKSTNKKVAPPSRKRKFTSKKAHTSPRKSRKIVANDIQDSGLCAFTLSHGNYLETAGKKPRFIVPKNIRLIQYTRPNYLLYETQAEHIIKRGCVPVTEPMIIYAVNKNTGEIRENGAKMHVTEPGHSTKNLDLQFDNFPESQRIILWNGEVKTVPHASDATVITLNTMLQIFSDAFAKTKPNTILNVIQLSCRAGKLQSDDADVDELARMFKDVKIKDYASAYSIGEDDVGFLTERDAIRYSEEVKKDIMDVVI